MSESIPERQHTVKSSKKHSPRSSAGDAFSALVVQIFQLNGHLIAAGDAMARPAGQTSARWQVLAAVEEAPLTVAQIARVLGLARQSVQRIADILEQEGMTTYEENPDHLRAKLLQLTPQGRATLHTIQAAQQVWADTLGAELGEEDLRAAIAILARVLQKITPSPGRRERG